MTGVSPGRSCAHFSTDCSELQVRVAPGERVRPPNTRVRTPARSGCDQQGLRAIWRSAWLAAAGSLILVCGCASRSSGPELVAVTGTVTLDGKPLQNGIIRFLPDVDRQTSGPIASAVLNKEGQFSLMSPGGRAGVVAGHHFVTLICDELPVHEVSPGVFTNGDKTCLLPKRYADEKTSELTAEVPAGGGVIDFALTSSGKP